MLRDKLEWIFLFTNPNTYEMMEDNNMQFIATCKTDNALKLLYAIFRSYHDLLFIQYTIHLERA